MTEAPTPPAHAARARWRANLRRTVLLLSVWALAGPVAGILFVEQLNAFRIGGAPLGFWVSQQGSIYVFVVLIFLYAVLADRGDRERGPEGDAGRGRGAGGSVPPGRPGGPAQPGGPADLPLEG